MFVTKLITALRPLLNLSHHSIAEVFNLIKYGQLYIPTFTITYCLISSCHYATTLLTALNAAKNPNSCSVK